MSNIYSNDCHVIFITSMNLSDIDTLNINGVYYCVIITKTTKGEAVNFLQKLI